MVSVGLALILAFAEGGDPGACDCAEIVVSRPADGQTGVPINSRFVALGASDCGNGGILYEGELRVQGGEVIAETSGTTSSPGDTWTEGELMVLEPGGLLKPNTTYEVELRSMPETGNAQPILETTRIEFTTGDAEAAEFTEAPTIALNSATVAKVGNGNGRFEAMITLTPAADPSGQGYVVLYNDAAMASEYIQRYIYRHPDPIELQSSGWIETNYREKACVVAVQVDAAGREGPPSEEICVDAMAVAAEPLDGTTDEDSDDTTDEDSDDTTDEDSSPGGCSIGTAPHNLASLAFLLLLGLRSRRPGLTASSGW